MTRPAGLDDWKLVLDNLKRQPDSSRSGTCVYQKPDQILVLLRLLERAASGRGNDIVATRRLGAWQPTLAMEV
jgi:hypothetical protein